MEFSRRDLSLFLPALLASQSAAQPAATPTRTFRFEDLVVKKNGENRSRDVIKAVTHKGATFDMHETELAPGAMPHAAHAHEHEEMVMIREGTLEITIAGKKSTLGPGSVAFVASNEHHGWRNIATTRAHYFVIAFGR